MYTDEKVDALRAKSACGARHRVDRSDALKVVPLAECRAADIGDVPLRYSVAIVFPWLPR